MKNISRIILIILLGIEISIAFPFKNNTELNTLQNGNQRNDNESVDITLTDIIFLDACQQASIATQTVGLLLFKEPIKNFTFSFPQYLPIKVRSYADNTEIGDINCRVNTGYFQNLGYQVYSCEIADYFVKAAGTFYFHLGQDIAGTKCIVKSFNSTEMKRMFGATDLPVNPLQDLINPKKIILGKYYKTDTIFLTYKENIKKVPEEAAIGFSSMECQIHSFRKSTLQCLPSSIALMENETSVGTISTLCPGVYSEFMVVVERNDFPNIIQFTESYDTETKCGLMNSSYTELSMTLYYKVLDGAAPNPFDLEDTCLFLTSQNGGINLHIRCSSNYTNQSQITNDGVAIKCKCDMPSNELELNYRLYVDQNCIFNNDTYLLRPFEIGSAIGVNSHYTPVPEMTKIQGISTNVDYGAMPQGGAFVITYLKALDADYLPFVRMNDKEYGDIIINKRKIKDGTVLEFSFTKRDLPPEITDFRNLKTYKGHMINICEQPEVPVTIGIKDSAVLPYLQITEATFPYYCNHYNGTAVTPLFLKFTPYLYTGAIADFKMNLMNEYSNIVECTCTEYAFSTTENGFYCSCIPNLGNRAGVYYPIMSTDYYEYDYYVKGFTFPNITANFTKTVVAYPIAPFVGEIITPSAYIQGDSGIFVIVMDRPLDLYVLPYIYFSDTQPVYCFIVPNEGDGKYLGCAITKDVFPIQERPYIGTYYDVCSQAAYEVDLYVLEVVTIQISNPSIYGESLGCTALPRGTEISFVNSHPLIFTSFETIPGEKDGFILQNTILSSYIIRLECTIFITGFTCVTLDEPPMAGYYFFNLQKDYVFLEGTAILNKTTFTNLTDYVNVNYGNIKPINSFIGASYTYDYINGLQGRFTLIFDQVLTTFVPAISAYKFQVLDEALECYHEDQFVQCLFGPDKLAVEGYSAESYSIYMSNICGTTSEIFTLNVKNTGLPIVILSNLTYDNYWCSNIKTGYTFSLLFTNGDKFSNVPTSVPSIKMVSQNDRYIIKLRTECKVTQSSFVCEVTQDMPSTDSANGLYKVELEYDYNVENIAIIYRYKSEISINAHNRYVPIDYANLNPYQTHDYGISKIGKLVIPFYDSPNTDTYVYVNEATKPRLTCSPVGNNLECKFKESLMAPGAGSSVRSHSVKVKNVCGTDDDYAHTTMNVTKSQVLTKPEVDFTSALFEGKCGTFRNNYTFSLGYDLTTAPYSGFELFDVALVKDQTDRIAASCNLASGVFYCQTKDKETLKSEGLYNAYIEEQLGNDYSIARFTSLETIYLTKKHYVGVSNPSTTITVSYDYKEGSYGTIKIPMKAAVKDSPTVMFGTKKLDCSGKKNELICKFSESQLPPTEIKGETSYVGELINVCGQPELNLVVRVKATVGKKKTPIGLIICLVFVFLLIGGIFFLGLFKCRRTNIGKSGGYYGETNEQPAEETNINNNYFLN